MMDNMMLTNMKTISHPVIINSNIERILLNLIKRLQETQSEMYLIKWTLYYLMKKKKHSSMHKSLIK